MILPPSYTDVKYFLKFSVSENFTEITGNDNHIITKAGSPQLLPQRNRDYTLKLTTFSFDMYSTREVLKGMRFKATINNIDMFYGLVEDVSYDEDKNRYSVKIAHEFSFPYYF